MHLYKHILMTSMLAWTLTVAYVFHVCLRQAQKYWKNWARVMFPSTFFHLYHPVTLLRSLDKFSTQLNNGECNWKILNASAKNMWN